MLIAYPAAELPPCKQTAKLKVDLGYTTYSVYFWDRFRNTDIVYDNDENKNAILIIL